MNDSLQDFRQRFLNGTLPRFLDQGWDAVSGGSVEKLTPTGAAVPLPYRRCMVHARQLFVYAQWGQALAHAPYLDHADRIHAYLLRHFQDAEHGGWIERIALDGTPVDTHKVLYTHAFVLLALSAYAWLPGREAAQATAYDTLHYIQKQFAAAGPGLFHTRLDRVGTPLSGTRDQNPHMHLFEALLMLFAHSGDATVATLATAVLDAVLAVFGRDGPIVEHVAGDLPVPAGGVNLVEPGHQSEWAWLIDWHGRLLGTEAYRARGETLFAAACTQGWDTTRGGFYDQLQVPPGRMLRDTKRLWPLLESLKAASVYPAVAAACGPGRDAMLAFLLTHYLQADGRWHEHLDAQLQPLDDAMPASSCYHLGFALAELLRTAHKNEKGVGLPDQG